MNRYQDLPIAPRRHLIAAVAMTALTLGLSRPAGEEFGVADASALAGRSRARRPGGGRSPPRVDGTPIVVYDPRTRRDEMVGVRTASQCRTSRRRRSSELDRSVFPPLAPPGERPGSVKGRARCSGPSLSWRGTARVRPSVDPLDRPV